MKKVLRIVLCIVKHLLFISCEKRKQKQQQEVSTSSNQQETDSESEENDRITV